MDLQRVVLTNMLSKENHNIIKLPNAKLEIHPPIKNLGIFASWIFFRNPFSNTLKIIPLDLKSQLIEW